MTGNQLKILALVSMTLDHIGVVMFPNVLWLRIVGRLAFPIFAYMIAEGCFYTHSKGKYLGGICALGLVCQLVYWFALDSLEQSILTTLALGIVTIYAFQWWAAHVPVGPDGVVRVASAALLVPIAAVAFDLAACVGLPAVLAGTDFTIDYGFVGAVLPTLVYLPRLRDEVSTRSRAALCDASGFAPDAAELVHLAPLPDATRRRMSLVFMAVGLMALSLTMLDVMHGVQWFSLATVVVLAFYNGERGKWKMKYLFYIYYPLHLVVIWGIAQLLH